MGKHLRMASAEPAWSRAKDRVTYISGSSNKTLEFDCDLRSFPEPNITCRWRLTIDDMAVADMGQYMCIVAKFYGAISWTFTVEVLQRTPVAPIVEEIDNQTAIEGDTVRFTCNIILSDSQPFLQWFQHYKVNDSEKGTPNVKMLQQSGYMKTIDDPQNLVLRNCLPHCHDRREAANLQNKNMTASSQFSHGSHGYHDQIPLLPTTRLPQALDLDEEDYYAREALRLFAGPAAHSYTCSES
ncbi:hypothetical protein DPMN_149063 [Dreissena polymorpha]|uniref:Immunoglobulin domain-containing protein n=1 Tax=Dreissena polymorpha TaxID=45954 RepID=A0A9D4FDP1_DREPO|nr:hypothetical protein DPMN_149063 [Dreissena polymorpha]